MAVTQNHKLLCSVGSVRRPHRLPNMSGKAPTGAITDCDALSKAPLGHLLDKREGQVKA